jgi:serine/threonine-protein kinase
MIELRVLGAGDITGIARDAADALCGQPKRFAVLAYLALTSPEGYQRRDRLVGLFWPDLDQERARTQLRRALFEIRSALGEAVLVTRGDEEVAVDAAVLRCDAVELADAFERGRHARVLELYRLERERAAIRDKASASAWSLAARAEESGDQTFAARFARKAAELAPTDERQLRRVMLLLERVGDRSGAIAVYEDCRRRVQREYQTPFSAETRALAERIRAGAM